MMAYVTEFNEFRCLDENEIDEVSGGPAIAACMGLVFAAFTVYTVFRQIGYEAGKDQALRDNRADEKNDK